MNQLHSDQQVGPTFSVTFLEKRFGSIIFPSSSAFSSLFCSVSRCCCLMCQMVCSRQFVYGAIMIRFYKQFSRKSVKRNGWSGAKSTATVTIMLAQFQTLVLLSAGVAAAAAVESVCFSSHSFFIHFLIYRAFAAHTHMLRLYLCTLHTSYY